MIHLHNNDIQLEVSTSKLFPFRNATAFLADNHQRSRTYQQGHWDGYKYIVDHNGLMLGGHLPKVINYFRNEEIVDHRVLPDELKNWAKYLPTQLGKYTLTEFQREAFVSMVTTVGNDILFPRGIIGMATNGGKSLVIAAAVKALKEIKPNVRILLLFLQVELLDQLSELFNELHLRHDVLLSDADMAKRKITTDLTQCKVLMAMTQTLYGKMADFGIYVEDYDVVMVDESHLAAAPNINAILTTCTAWGRWGFSGTPFDGKSDEQENTLVAQFGPILYKVNNRTLIDAGVSAEPTIYSVDYDFFGRFISHQDGLKVLINSLERNMIAYKWIKKNPEKRYLVVVELIEHVDVLMNLLQEFNPLPMHAELNRKTRTENLQKFKDYECTVLIANGTAKHGLNVKDINCIIYLRAGKSPVWLNQIIGRGLRLKTTGEQEFTVVDPYDNIHIFRPQSDERLKQYQVEGYDVKRIKFSEI
jgi:superfamily II DNA or RNA helicase